MLRSLKIGARAMQAQIARNDVIANNLANAATTGFRRQVARFERTAPSGAAPSSPTPAPGAPS